LATKKTGTKQSAVPTWDMLLQGTALGEMVSGVTHEDFRHSRIPPVAKLMVMDFAAGAESVPVGGEGRDLYYCGHEDVEIARRWFIREKIGFVERNRLKLRKKS
jgi:hypothetical protein